MKSERGVFLFCLLYLPVSLPLFPLPATSCLQLDVRELVAMATKWHSSRLNY